MGNPIISYSHVALRKTLHSISINTPRAGDDRNFTTEFLVEVMSDNVRTTMSLDHLQGVSPERIATHMQHNIFPNMKPYEQLYTSEEDILDRMICIIDAEDTQIIPRGERFSLIGRYFHGVMSRILQRHMS